LHVAGVFLMEDGTPCGTSRSRKILTIVQICPCYWTALRAARTSLAGARLSSTTL
jgi:hypothetical protein